MPTLNLSGIVLDLKLDAITGDGKVLDDSGHNNHAVVTGSVTVVDDPIFGHCLDFPGGGDFLTVKDPFPNNAGFAICLWVKPAALDDGFRGIIGKEAGDGDAARKPSLWMAPANKGLHYDSNSESLDDRKGAILDGFFAAAGEWVHICWVFDGSTYWFNRDGAHFSSASGPGRFYRSDSGYRIGGVDNFFRGRIARVRIFDQPIGPGELAQVIAFDRLGESSERQSAEVASPAPIPKPEPGEVAPTPQPTTSEVMEMPTTAPIADPLDVTNGQVDPSTSVLAAILRYNEGRKPRLVRLKLKRMAGDPFAFFRGTNHLFADAWAGLKPPDEGPSFPICGDLHLENFGAYRDDDGELLYDINDFDEAIVGPCSLDLVRCSTSILLASEVWRLTPLQASGMVLKFLDNYRSVVTGRDTRRELDGRVPRLARGPIWEILGQCAREDQAGLLDRYTVRLKKGRRRIIRGKDTHPALKPDLSSAIGEAVEAYGAASGRADFFQVLDVTGRVAGIGSLGVARYTVLVDGGGSSKTHRLFDLKACRPSVLVPRVDRPWPFPDETDAARVVRAQRMLQAHPTAGLDIVTVDGTSYRFREMIPEENRSSLDEFNKQPRKLGLAIEEAGVLTALSHRRGAEAHPEGGGVEGLERWATGPALDSVLVGAARFAEHTRSDYRRYRKELKSPSSLPKPLRKLCCR